MTTQSASVTIVQTVNINGNSVHTSITANCAPDEVKQTTTRLLSTMSEAASITRNVSPEPK
jgi:hypothetical protein